MNIINPYRFAAGAAAFDGFGNASRVFDGVNDYIDLGDSDDFTFSNGSNDTPFSACAWVKAVDWTSFWIFSKFATSALREWYVATAADDTLYFQINDGDSVRIGRSCSGALTSYQNAWVHIAATYDGSGSSTGMNVYLTEVGGTTTAIDTTDYNTGTYVTMENTTQPLLIGSYDSASRFADGKIADARLYSKELTSSEVQDLADGVHVTDSLLGWWLDDDDDVLDNAGTNDGTNNGSTYDADGPAD